MTDARRIEITIWWTGVLIVCALVFVAYTITQNVNHLRHDILIAVPHKIIMQQEPRRD